MESLWKILIFVLLIKNVVAQEIDEDTVEIKAPPEASRKARNVQIFYRAQASPEGSPCLTNMGVLGSCTSFKTCYPYFKFPDLNAWDSWIVGNHDTCRYVNNEGRQAFGVCCTNPITPIPATDESDKRTTTQRPNKITPISGGSQYPNWPPPIPTHPPNHTPATHPVYFGAPGPTTTASPLTTTKTTTTKKTTTTRRSTTWPTKPPSNKPQQTTQWPPPIPTHPTRPTPTHPLLTTTTRRPPPVITTPSNEISNEVSFSGACGAKNGNPDQERIVGGHNADPNEWPWIAVLFNGGKQFCGGSLIDDRHILGAAHCVAHMSSWDVARLTVRLGDHNIRTDTELKHVERKIKRIVRHKGFDSRTLYNDIAILTMDSPVTFTKAVHPVCLPAGGARQYNGMSGVVVGWGSLRENGPQPAVLQEVSLPIWTNQECKQKYGIAAPGGIIDSMLCAGVAAKDSCSGDSGGPLVVNDGGRYTQVGIVSWGIGCGKGQYPGVYSRVTSFMQWIAKNTKEN